MILSERTIIKKSHKHYNELMAICHLSKNLYNVGLYRVRQHYVNNKEYLSYAKLDKILRDERQIDYIRLPQKVSQQTLKLVEQDFKSFFALLKKKGNTKVKLPRYKEKEGRLVTIYTNQAISVPSLRLGFLHFSKTEIKIETKQKTVKQVRLIPNSNHLVVEVLYEVKSKDTKVDNNRYASIDLGVDNLVTMASNVVKPLIYKGKKIKSINQFYNKQLAHLKSEAITKHNTYSTNRLSRLHLKRNNKVNDCLHKVSRDIVNHLVSNDINTLVIGNNKLWKQDINIGKRNNQNFINIPHTRLIEMLTYKCKLQGITVKVNEESYTSKCSFLDNEEVKKHDSYKGKRVSRGLFKSSENRIINADLNGALNILRKCIGEFQYPKEVCSTPLVKIVY